MNLVDGSVRFMCIFVRCSLSMGH